MKQNQFTHLTDQEIVVLINQGKKELFEEIVHRYNSYLFKIGRTHGFKQEDIEDLIQETYIKVYENLNSFHNQSALKTWIVQIMLHLCYHRKHKFSYTHEQAAGEKINNQSDTLFFSLNNNGEEKIQNRELRNILEHIIMELPEDNRMVFLLRVLLDLSIKETAAILKENENNIKSRLLRAKKMIQSAILKEYSLDDLFDLHLSHHNKIVAQVMQLIQGKKNSVIEKK
ncbi:MAG: sigma-70 family RNA polymerase sigma factor [Chitinophagales bacterium]|nr:sigma-70 family RNA polymerase sigma factor [Chitinophagales bacterium]